MFNFDIKAYELINLQSVVYLNIQIYLFYFIFYFSYFFHFLLYQEKYAEIVCFSNTCILIMP